MVAKERDSYSSGPTHRFVETNGIRMHLVEQGEGPLVLLCHGFPESSYSWRHQLSALAAAGFRAVAPDMRGYGNTDRPEPIDQYTLLHLVGDMIGVLDALDYETAVIAGHDWGAPVAWHAALLRPDRFRAVIGLSVPFIPRRPDYPSKSYPQTDDAVFYQSYFQSPGVAEADLEHDVRFTTRAFLYDGSGDAPHSAIRSKQAGHVFMVPRQGGMMANWVNPTALPPWLTEADVEVYVDQFKRTGYRGGLNWYRNIDRNWELMAPFAGLKITVPALLIAGDRDVVLAFSGMDYVIANLSQSVPKLQKTLILPGCGHWTQQERPQEVNEAMLEFLRQI
ncbi:MAG: alpha/beta hydrolase [Verrucomicrobia bacterium]|nr:alpha/beta hydrolase [Verrucomicrobiota bacterium]